MKVRQEIRPGYTVGQRWLEIAATVVFFGLTVWTVARLHVVVTLMRPAHASWLIVAGLVGGLLFADFISGFVHWLADNWGKASWPVLGTKFIRPFREHHDDPKDITRHGFLELNGDACIISAPTFWWGMAEVEASAGYTLFLGVFWLSTAYWVLGTNQFHAWAHADTRPGWVRALQRARIILSTPVHDRHHVAPHDRNYCITTGWFNEPLRVLRFFETLEWLVTKVSGIRPAHGKIEPRQEGSPRSH